MVPTDKVSIILPTLLNPPTSAHTSSEIAFTNESGLLLLSRYIRMINASVEASEIRWASFTKIPVIALGTTLCCNRSRIKIRDVQM